MSEAGEGDPEPRDLNDERRVANAILASTCAGVTPWLAWLALPGGEAQGAMGHGAWGMGRGEGGLCCIVAPVPPLVE